MDDREWEKVREFHGEVYKRRQKTTSAGGVIILIVIVVFLGLRTQPRDKGTVEQSDKERPFTHSRSVDRRGTFREASEATEALADLLSRLKSLSDVKRNEAKLISALQRMDRAKKRIDEVDPDSYEIGRGALDEYKKRMNVAVERIKVSNMKRNSDAQQRVNVLMWQYGG
jgi:hypothetical protein